MKTSYDYIIVGSGIAGLYTALLVKEQGSVLLITKGSIDDCNTKYAQGGIAAAIGKNDSPELHFRDTIAAGDGLCDEEAVRILANEAADRIADLVNFGIPFDTLDGKIALTMEAAHSVPRILHAGGDATGEHIEVTLSNQVRSSKIQLLEDCLATEILVEKGTVKGIKALDCRLGSIEEFECRYLILATGGAGQLFKFTTNSDVATGDGIALAFKAGAEIVDMEFFQFHPTALRLPGVTPFLISEAVRGEGGVLRNVDGYRFMPDYAPEGDLAPRDIVVRSIVYEMKKTGSDRVFIDITHLPPHITTTRFPHIYRFCLDHRLDITKDLVPVAPAAHYMMGGIRVNSWGETSIAGLFAAGETACTGVHGANRLASNSMLEVVVFSKRIMEKTRRGAKIEAPIKDAGTCCSLSQRQVPKAVPAPSLSALQRLHWDKVGIIRNQEGLTEAANTLAAWQKSLPQPTDRHSYELNNLVLTGRLVTEAALLREESRGAHFRSDFPHSPPQWQRHIIFTSHELHNLVLTGRLVTEAALLREESRGAHFRSDFPHSPPPMAAPHHIHQPRITLHPQMGNIMSCAFMKILESAPERYDAGIDILTLGRLRQLKRDIVNEFIAKDDKVLELGCGTGSLAILCAAKGAVVTGIDLSPKMLAIAHRKLKKAGLTEKIKLLRMSAMDMDTTFDDNSFNVITSTLVFSEMSREEIRYVLNQCHRVLKANGSLLIADEIIPPSPLAKFLLLLFRLPFTIIAYIFTQTTTRAVAKLDEDLRQAGFSIIKRKSYLLATMKLFQARKVVT